MKRGRSRSLLYYYGGLGKKNGDGGERSKQETTSAMMSAKAHKQAQRKNVMSSSFCVFCDAKVNPTIVVQGDHEKEKKMVEELEGDQKGEGVVVEIISGIEVEIGGVLEEKVVENRIGENAVEGVEDQEKGVLGNHALQENNNNNGEMLQEASEMFSEQGFGDWNNEWACNYPFYVEYGAYYYWDVLGNEAAANQWVENLWKD